MKSFNQFVAEAEDHRGLIQYILAALDDKNLQYSVDQGEQKFEIILADGRKILSDINSVELQDGSGGVIYREVDNPPLLMVDRALAKL